MSRQARFPILSPNRQLAEWVFLIATLLCGAMISGYFAWSEQGLTESTEAARMAAQERIIDETLHRQITGLQAALENVRNALPDEMRSCKPPCGKDALESLHNALPGVRALLVLDSLGNVLARDQSYDAAHTDSLAWARWQRTMRDPTVLYLVRSDSLAPTLANDMALLLPASKGRAVVALLRRSFFEASLQSAMYAPDMQGALGDMDGQWRTKLASTTRALPASTASLHVARHLDRDGLAPMVYAIGMSDGNERLVVQRMLPVTRTGLDRPLMVEVSRDVEELLRPSQHLIYVYGLAWLALALASLSVLVTLQHRRRTLRQAAERHAVERADDAERIDMTLESAGLGLWEWDLAANSLRLDARAAVMAGRTPGQRVVDADWMQDVHPDDHPLVRERLSRYLNGDAVAFEVEYRLRHANGAWIWVHSLGKVVKRDDAGRPLRMVGTRQDIGTRKQAEADIQHLAFYDSLTNLPNRRLLQDRLDHTLTRSVRNRRAGAVMFLDLDNFKDLNDSLGHDIGDRLLQQVALRLQGVVREADTVARLGGDEFVILLDDLDESGGNAEQRAGLVADKILGALSPPHFLDRHEVHISPSIGIAMFGDQERTPEELLRQADLAMYAAKSAGRNTFRFFVPILQLTLDEQAKIEADLRYAVRRDEFHLYFQPVVDDAGRIICLEALMRWDHPERGLVGPGQFIPIAEKSGLILGIGRWVLERACQQLAQWSREPRFDGIKIAVNVSARQFGQDDFIDQVMHALYCSGADPRRLKLEITESVVLHDVEDVITKMGLLKARGVSFALDDFGTGYSSLSYLQRLPLDELKIDKSFVHDMIASQNAVTIVKAIVGLAKSLGMDVVAEGVETEAQQLFLADCGCLRYQGYLIAKPLPAEAIFQTLNGKQT